MFPFPCPLLAVGQAVPVGPYGAHRYWRLFVATNQGDVTGIVVNRVEFHGTVGGSTLVPTLTSNTNVIFSDDSVGSEAWHAFANTGNSWYADSAPTNQYVGYDFGSAVSVAEVAVRVPSSGTNPLTRGPRSCRLEYSDDNSTWSTAISFTIYNNVLGNTYTFPATTPAAGYHTFWRVNILTNNGGTSLGLAELEFRATIGGADQTPTMTSDNGTTGGRPVFSAETVGNEAYRVFDDTTGNWFKSGTTTGYLGCCFPSPVIVAEVALTGQSTLNRNPNSIQIEYSDDGSTWTSVKSATLGTWTTGETKIVDV